MNELFVNKRVWKAMSEDELEDYKQALFDYYKNERGFPYFDLSDKQKEKEVQKMVDFDSSKPRAIAERLYDAGMLKLS